MNTITEKDIQEGITNLVNNKKTHEYIVNSRCGICNRKLEYRKDYVWCKVNGGLVLSFYNTSYNGKIFLDCRRCHRALVFFDKIRFWIMKFLMRL